MTPRQALETIARERDAQADGMNASYDSSVQCFDDWAADLAEDALRTEAPALAIGRAVIRQYRTELEATDDEGEINGGDLVELVCAAYAESQS